MKYFIFVLLSAVAFKWNIFFNQSSVEMVNYKSVTRNQSKNETRSDILQGQALFRGVKQLKQLMLNNFEKFSFPSIEKRWTKDKETDG